MLELRKKAKGAVSKKTIGVSSDQLLVVVNDDGMTAILEMNSKTDFVA